MSAVNKTIASPVFLPRTAWMRFNRGLAWALVVSPIVQIVLQVRFWPGLYFDLAGLAAHGVLSLALFGIPKNQYRKVNLPMHLLGFRTGDLSPRNNFLMTGYRVLLACISITVLCFAPTAWPLVFLFGFYMIPRLPISVIQHISDAGTYAFQRWGVRKSANDLAVLTVIFYSCLSIINLVRALLGK